MTINLNDVKLVTHAHAWDPATLALVSAMSTKPDSSRIAVINRLIVQLKAGGIWNKLDVFYMMAAHHQSAAILNWKAPDRFLMLVNNSPAFIKGRGFQFDGVAAYNNTQFVASQLSGAGFSGSSGHFGLVSLTDASGAAVIDVGASPFNVLRCRNNLSTTTRYGTTNVTVATTIGRGHFLGQRLAVDAVNGYAGRDGIAMVAGASTPIATPTVPFLIGTNVTTGPYSAKLLSAFHAGAELTNAEWFSLYAACLTYRSVVGAT